MKRLDELIMKLLDQTIDGDELRELTNLTRSSEGQESLLRLMELESHLQASGYSSAADQVIGQIQQERCDRVERGVMTAISESGNSVGVRTHQSANRSLSRLTFMLVGMTAAAACLLFLFVSNSTENSKNEIAQLNPHGSVVTILDADGKPRFADHANQPLKLHPNETIEISQAVDTAEIVYADGTKLELLGETRVRLIETPDGAKQVTILSGLIQADVVPQPEGRPLRIVTQAATLEVLGTTLGVEVREASTQLGVATGRVAMTRMADGERVEVEAGRFATVTESTNEPLQSHPFPELPTEWSEDFESGLPPGWGTGQLVEHAGGWAVLATSSPRSDNGRFVVTSHNAWQEGDHALCKIDRHSVLHLKIRQRVFARITIMIGTRSYPPASGRIGGNLFYTKKSWNEELPADTWKTISVPLKDVDWQMKQGKKVNGPSDLAGIAAYLIHISTMSQDAGVTIDRMWITNEAEANQL